VSLFQTLNPVRRIKDSARTFISGTEWLLEPGIDKRKAPEIAQRRSESFLDMNRGILGDFGVRGQVGGQRGDVGVWLESDTRVGALPLLSPASAKPELGLVVEPRFAWSSAGDMLVGTGFRITPEILPLPRMVPNSDRQIPSWVLSATVLSRIEALLKQSSRRFEMNEAVLSAPKGQVNWTDYATKHFSRGQCLSLPCRFPDLLVDAQLYGAMHWTVLRHQDALRTQLGRHKAVLHLLKLCDNRSGEVFKRGLEAMNWTVDERGLGGTSDLAGLPWRMDMAIFFEAWIESIADATAKRYQAKLTSGRRHETTVRLKWSPHRMGTQRALIPDVVLQRSDVTLVIDAKYKRHAQLVGYGVYGKGEHDWQEQHREDLLQVLAYSSLFDTPRVVACLAYPTPHDQWQTLADQKRVMSRATVRQGLRQIEVALVAVPMSGTTDIVSDLLGDLLLTESIVSR
jgi:McrBC 5-methylcytosine restriction system component